MADLLFYFKLGWQHIISADALDHQLFILALAIIYTIHQWKAVLILVTAFTIGHSLTLALSVLDVIRFPSNWVEFLIPVTIVITAAANLRNINMARRNMRLNYWLALFFGLIHGMGFANSIRMIMARDEHLYIDLLGFNLGLEAGQIICVAAILLILVLVIDVLHVKRKTVIFFVSSGVFALALQMALQRLPF